jgi:hypothetical protein
MLLDTSRSDAAVCILGQRFSLFVRCSLDPAVTAVFATQFSNFAIIECRGIIMYYWQNVFCKVMGLKSVTVCYPFIQKILQN